MPQPDRKIACVTIVCPAGRQNIDLVTVVRPGTTVTGLCNWDGCAVAKEKWPVFDPEAIVGIESVLGNLGVATVVIQSDGMEPRGVATLHCDLLKGPEGKIRTQPFSIKVIS